MMGKLSWADKKFGKICKKCGKRHPFIGTPGVNLPKNADNECRGEEIST